LLAGRILLLKRRGFRTNLLWIALGCGFLAFARSYGRDGHRVTALIVCVIAALALGAGIILWPHRHDVPESFSPD
jgi:predicted permease